MKWQSLFTVAALASMAASANGQSFARRAELRGGNGNEGKCTVEVVVDGAARVSVHGDLADLTNLRGQPAQWRRFVCTSPMPSNPVGFRFQGIDGRGRQQLISDPRNGRPAVVEIEDRDNGQERYTFDLIWNAGGGPYSQYPQERGPRDGDRGEGYRGERHADFTVDQAVQVCKDSIRDQAARRYHADSVEFRRTTIDDTPGRHDWVIGNVELRRFRQPDQVMKFSCSVDFATGRVRSANMEPFYDDGRRH